MKNNKPAIFFDRDGVINVEKNYVHKISDFEFIEGIFDIAKKAKRNNYLLFVITNQAGIGRGLYSEHEFHILNNWMLEQFKKNNAEIDKVYFCPDHPQYGEGKYRKDSFNRKPNPGMILKACNEFEVDIDNSILVGDKISDIDAGISAGIKTNLLFNNKIKENKNFFIKINKILEIEKYLIRGT